MRRVPLILAAAVVIAAGTVAVTLQLGPADREADIPSPMATPPGLGPPPPLSFEPDSVAFWNPEKGLVAGELCSEARCRGFILRTSNGGLTWEPFVQEGSDAITHVTVLGKRVAWATLESCRPRGCRSSGLIGTRDSGKTWRLISRQEIYAPSFVSAKVGWALGPDPSVTDVHGPFGRRQFVMTVDGGIRWSRLTNPCPAHARSPVSLSFVSSLRGWLVCAGELATAMAGKAVLTTEDGGSTWQRVAEVKLFPSENQGVGSGGLYATGHPLGIHFLPNGRGWLWELRGTLWRTTNGGITWHPVNKRFFQPDVVSVDSAWLLPGGTGFAVTSRPPESFVIRTQDGGRTWTTVLD